ncbi:hypothetical protein FQN54_008910 [Arachnomyces sp. PD_36]|nr:hypothetical protein FQN54_008910 [Arachnomyces sp. PD_36]
MELPNIPVPLDGFIPHLGEQSRKGILLENALEPFKAYESRLREVFAQEPTNEVISDPHINTVPVFAGHEQHLKTKARQLDQETPEESEKYMLPLDPSFYNEDGSPATVRSLDEFKNNFRLFSESSLVDLDWSNVVAAGSSVTTCLLPVPAEHGASKKAQRSYYHDKLAPASDVDLFIYGLDEKQAVEKMKQIEKCITDSILEETTVVRTKNALTIASKYPTRHVQIVLRLYKSVSEILTGFDVDCSCTAFDGSQVWASPRALSAFVTQTNVIDITRRSPSYENRLAKYARRGFEVHWPNLDRSKVDPTIFERSFSHVLGLARLLVMEKFPTSGARDSYLDDRRMERGRPPSLAQKFYRNPHGNLKEQQPEDIAEWVEDENVSSYHTFTIPYGPKYNARKIERLLYKKDLLLNAEWNKPKDRKVDLHRHPAFFGAVQHVVDDCCGFCPSPSSSEETAVAAEESKKFVSGKLEFMKDDPGRQAIGSFSPITDSEWTEMAYISDTARLCQAIVAEDLESVRKCCSIEGFDIDQRDYTGRTPLHLAITCSTLEIVQCLLECGARVVARVAGGFTALHLAAERGNADIVRAILQKSEENEAEYLEKMDEEDGKRSKQNTDDQDSDDSDGISIVSEESDSPAYATTEGSMVNITTISSQNVQSEDSDEDIEEPNFYDHADILSWDHPVSPLHLAILNGHLNVIETLASEFGADVLLPVVLKKFSYSVARAILPIVLALHHPTEHSKQLLTKLLDCGASSTQADTSHVTALHFIVGAGDPELLDCLFEVDGPAARLAIDHPAVESSYVPKIQLPLSTSIKSRGSHMISKLLGHGAGLSASSERLRNFWARHRGHNKMSLEEALTCPLIIAAQLAQPEVLGMILSDTKADVNLMTPDSHALVNQGSTVTYARHARKGETILDIVNYRIKCWEQVEFELPAEDVDIPELENDSFYLEGTTEGTYEHWAVQNEICAARTAIGIMKKDHKANMENRAKAQEKALPKMERKQREINRLEEIKHLLLKRGAKTFGELHPQLAKDSREAPTNTNAPQQEQNPDCPEFKVAHRFSDPDKGNVDYSQYIQLFQAAWDGDVQKVKNLTLGSWGPDNNLPPLRVSVHDKSELTPFAIAVVRRHFGLAKVILDIADAQYLPKGEAQKRKRYEIVIDAEADDSDSDSYDGSRDNMAEEDHGIGVRFDLVDDQHTIDDIRDVANTVKSTVSPSKLLRQSSNLSWFLGDAEDKYRQAFLSGVSQANSSKTKYGYFQPSVTTKKDKNSWKLYVNNLPLGDHWTKSLLLDYAIRKNDIAAVKFLIQQYKEFPAHNSNEEDADEKQQFITLPSSHFALAMSMGQTEIMGHLIAKTGAEFPFSNLMKVAGVNLEKKPKYYQGLSVYGKKRQDWASEGGNGYSSYYNRETTDNLLLRAIKTKNLDSIRWFLSDQPEIKYKEFASTYKNDERLKLLSETEGGFQGVLSSWLGARRHLALHCAVMAPPSAESRNSHVELILQHSEASLNAKNRLGATPLHFAFSLRRIMAAKSLLAAGADATTRDNAGCNLLHLILSKGAGDKMKLTNLFEALCDLLDPELIKQLATQRTYAASKQEGWGLQTPLAHWLESADDRNVDMLQAILKVTGGKELYIMDGRGNYPIHQVVRETDTKLARVILEFDPSFAQTENATGVTPLEICGNKLLRCLLVAYSDLTMNILPHRSLEWPVSSIQYRSQLDNWNGKDEPLQELNPSPYSGRRYREIRMRDLLRDSVAENSLKRKLVSLHDANQLVKRLSSKRWKRPGNEWARSEKSEIDESVQWVSSNRDASFEVGPFKKEAEEKNKA